MPTWSIRVKGKVHGVFFRQSTSEKANMLGLTGQVWNNTDGSVSIRATGETDALQALAEWCKQGPPRARVTTVDTEVIEDQSFEGFSILR